MWESIWAGAIGTILAAAMLGGAGWLYSNRRRAAAALEARKREKQRGLTTGALREGRDDVLARADELGKVVPVSTKGHQPVVVTMSDGSERYYYGSIAAYKRAMGPPPRTSPMVSYGVAAPKPLSNWSQVEIEAWLVEHGQPV